MVEEYFCAGVRQPLHNVSALQLMANLWRTPSESWKLGKQDYCSDIGIFFNE